MADIQLSKRDRDLFARFDDAIDAVNEEPYRKYWAALGHFIHVFAAVEFDLLMVLRKYTRVEDMVAGVVFSGARSKQAADWLNAVLEEQNKQVIKARLKRALDHLGTINTVRNNIVHWGARYDQINQHLIVSNKKRFSRQKREAFLISVDDLNAMRCDLYMIAFVFGLELHPSERRQKWVKELARPWLYKSPQPHRLDAQKGARRPSRNRKGNTP